MKSTTKVFQTKCRENWTLVNFFLLSSFLKDPTQLKSKEESHFKNFEQDPVAMYAQISWNGVLFENVSLYICMNCFYSTFTLSATSFESVNHSQVENFSLNVIIRK